MLAALPLTSPDPDRPTSPLWPARPTHVAAGPVRALRVRFDAELEAATRLAEQAIRSAETEPPAARAGAAALCERLARLMADARELVDATMADGREHRDGPALTSADLHDVLGHGLSLAAVLAGAAQATMPADPDLGRRQLARASAVLAQARGELDALWDRLATSRPGSGAARDALDLALLIGWARDAGEQVTLDADWAAVSAADPRVVEAVHRMVQEALTNARKHAPRAPVGVRVQAADGNLLLQVTSGRVGADPDPGTGSGLGLRLMRCRARELGGRMATVAGPTAFSVRASLPLRQGP